MEKSVPIKFRIEDKIVQASQGTSTLEALVAAGFPIDHSCGGFGTCGTCRVIVTQNLKALAPRNEIESEMAMDRSFLPQERLCCQMTPIEGLVLYRPDRVPIKKGFE